MTAEEQTLTIDESTLEAGQFSEEEMDSLRVGEEMYKEQDEMILGKYKNAEELAKAHVELEKKLGERTEEPEAEPEAEAETDEPEEGVSVLDKLWEERTSGEFSDETLQELAKTNPGELAKAYLQLREQGVQEEPTGLSEQDVTDLKNVVGGDANYEELVTWAENNLDKDEQDMYDTIVDRGDPLACYFAIQALQSRMRDSVGQDGRLIQGKPPSSGGNTFRSQAELVQAMADPRYDQDPAYRRDVQEKLERSDVNF
tara:strand:+ start:241 stop:1011 length:771 start_codon:yes stop_codon:yes gene_type:complete